MADEWMEQQIEKHKQSQAEEKLSWWQIVLISLLVFVFLPTVAALAGHSMYWSHVISASHSPEHWAVIEEKSYPIMGVVGEDNCFRIVSKNEVNGEPVSYRQIVFDAKPGEAMMVRRTRSGAKFYMANKGWDIEEIEVHLHDIEDIR